MTVIPQTSHPPVIEIVVPARNEAHRLPDGLAALCVKAATIPLRTAILVVDSASTDATADIVTHWGWRPAPVRLLRCDRPGKGRAVRAGLLATRAPFVGFCDADMATDLSAVDVAVRLLCAGHQVVIGSRGLAESDVSARASLLRKAGTVLFRSMARSVIPDIADTQCGFKFFAGPLARAAARSVQTDGFAFDVELLAACRRLGARVTEIPVQWRDVSGSSFSATRHSAAVFRDLARIRRRTAGGRDGPATAPGGGHRPLPSGWLIPHQRRELSELAGGANP
jgi:dolichyl-phosphate beta-glucosyltransferase